MFCVFGCVWTAIAFAKPSAYATVIGTFALMDLLIVTCFILQCSGCVFMYYGMLGKYIPMLKEERDERKRKQAEENAENQELEPEFDPNHPEYLGTQPQNQNDLSSNLNIDYQNKQNNPNS